MALAKKCMWLVLPLVAAGGLIEVLADIEPSGELAQFVSANDADCAARRRNCVTHGQLFDARALSNYASAEKGLVALKDECWSVWESRSGGVEVDPAWRVARTRWQPVLASLRAGAHAADLSRGDFMRGPRASISMRLLAQSECTFLLLEGRTLDAVHLSLDVLTYFVDTGLVFGNAPWGFAMAQGVERWWRAERIERLRPAERTAFARGLRVLLDRLSSPRLLAERIVPDHVAGWVRTVRDDGYPWNRSWTTQERLQAWEFGFSPKKQFLGYLANVVHLRDRWASTSQLAEVREICAAASCFDVLDSCLWAERDRKRLVAKLRELARRLR